MTTWNRSNSLEIQEIPSSGCFVGTEAEVRPASQVEFGFTTTSNLLHNIEQKVDNAKMVLEVVYVVRHGVSWCLCLVLSGG